VEKSKMSKPKWTPRRVRLGQIQAWAGNPRMSTKAQAQRIIASEKKFGQPVPFLLAPEADGRFLLYDGHQRLSAWLTIYGADYEMDAMVADRPLTDDEHKELIITLHTGATGSWDWNALSGWDAPQLQEWGMDADALKGWNNDALNLREMLDAEDVIPTLDELKERYGETGERDFYPIIRVQVAPETYSKYTALMKDMAGADDAEKFDALISRGC